ncbi:MAG: UDP-4-amino-4,6-dideoxy-N-acetyl-beta-L-altrosamine transaminase [Alphaproteobacteria bacterium]|nr:UDP-4-amino-4,6-dideoxy-N-acetyl-beta-L-altrosamine transaminase [Alphaproteobacteria bacterium]
MTGQNPFLPYARQSIEDDDVAAVGAALKDDLLTTGPRVAAFEAKLAEKTQARFAVACSSGTAALHLAVLGLGFGPGDCVVVPAVTFLATANAGRYVGADVVFADVDPETGLMTEETLAAALAKCGQARRSAVLPVHLAGQMVAMAAVAHLARASGAAVVEDASHALGSLVTSPEGERLPTGNCRHSDMATFSFHPAKAIAMGEGGAVTTNDAAMAARLRQLRNHGMTRDPSAFEQAELAFAPGGEANPWYYEMAQPGLNYRVTDVQCALGLSQLEKLDRFVARRRELVRRYDEMLARFSPVVQPIARVPECLPAWHIYPVLVDFAACGLDRATLMTRLRTKGIGTQVHYIPVHMQPYYRQLYGRLELPGAERYYARTLSLPLFPAMADGDVDRVVDALEDALGQTSG